MSIDEQLREKSRLEQERDAAIEAAREECKLGGSRSVAIAQSNLAIVFQMRLDYMQRRDLHVHPRC